MTMKKLYDDSRLASRRQFAKTIAATTLALTAAPMAASSSVAAQTSTTTKQSPAPPNPQPPPANSAPSPLAGAYAGVARARFGDRLTPEQLSQVKKDIDSNVRSADRLRSFKLKNEDEPDFVFSA